MDFNRELNQRLTLISNWLIENKIGTTEDKVEEIVWQILRCVVKHNIENDIYVIKEKLKQTPFIICEGNLWECLHK